MIVHPILSWTIVAVRSQPPFSARSARQFRHAHGMAKKAPNDLPVDADAELERFFTRNRTFGIEPDQFRH